MASVAPEGLPPRGGGHNAVAPPPTSLSPGGSIPSTAATSAPRHAGGRVEVTSYASAESGAQATAAGSSHDLRVNPNASPSAGLVMGHTQQRSGAAAGAGTGAKPGSAPGSRPGSRLAQSYRSSDTESSRPVATKYVEQLAAGQRSPLGSVLRARSPYVSGESLSAGARIIHEAGAPPATPKAPGPRGCWPRLRAWLRALVLHRWFERVVIALILANMVFVSTWDPLDHDPNSSHNRLLDFSDLVFQCLFTVEMVVKILALGLIRPKDAYLRDNWNVIDGLLVVSGWVTLGSSNISVGRLVRVLRPLRTISHVPGLKLIINSMLASIPQLLNVLGLCAFIFFMFGIVGIQLFGGKLSQRCHFPGSPPTVNGDDGQLCSTSGSSGRQCPVVGGVQTVCLDTGTSVNYGITNFDNIGTAFLTIFQCITLEGWVDVMYWISETMSMWFDIYFVSLVTFGSLFVLNLVVAVITLNLSAERNNQDVVEKASRWQELARIPEARLLVGDHAFSTADLMTQLVASTYQRQADIARLKRRSSATRPASGEGVAAGAGSSRPTSVAGSERKGGSGGGSRPGSATDGAAARFVTVPTDGSGRALDAELGITAAQGFSGSRSSEAWGAGGRQAAGAGVGVAPGMPPGMTPGVASPALRDVDGTAVVKSRRQSLPSIPGAKPHEVKLASGFGPLPPIAHGGVVAAQAAEQHLRRAMHFVENGCKSEAILALQLALAGVKGAAPGRHSVGSLPSDVDRQSIVTVEAGDDKQAPTVITNGGGQQLRLRNGRLSRADSDGSMSSGSEPRIDAARFAAARHLVETPHGSRVKNIHQDRAVVRFTDQEGRPLPGQKHRASIVASVAEENSKALVQMRLPASRRFGPFPYSATWRWWAWKVCTHAAFDWTILSLIMVNTIALAVEHHDMDPDFQATLQYINLVLTVLFGLEMLLKIAGLGVEGYVSDRFNVFDGLLVAINLVELSIQDGSGDASGVSALRTFRLMRVFKLMRSWNSLNVIITNILKSLPRIGPFTVVLLLFMMIYALIGMQLFGGKFGTGDDLPRTNYDTLLWSFVTTFQILTGENWNEVMYDAVRHTGWPSVVYFVSLVLMGTYIVLNLFLGILIDNFRQDDDDDVDAEAGIVAQARDEIKKRLGRAASFEEDGAGMALYMQGGHVHNVVMRRALARLASQRRMEAEEEALKLKRFEDHRSFKWRSLWGVRGSQPVRLLAGRIVIHPVFEGVILLLITISCVLLALDSNSVSPELKSFIDTMDAILTSLFTLELVVKVFAFGLYKHPGAYLRDGWNVLDALIVVFSILALLLAEQEVKVIKVIRFGRALRPLRVVKRLAGLRLVVNSVVKALPHCFHVAMLSVALFLLFGILGVNFFGGRFYSCTDATRVCLPRLAGDSCTADLACGGTFVNAAGATVAREWINPSYAGVSSYSFDSSLAAMLTLFEVANLELWHEVMWKASDVTRLGWAPEVNANQYAVFYFIAFVVMSSFFMLNLFVSVVVDNFNRLKHAALASPFLTPSQRKWIEMQERITRRRPQLMAMPPAASWRESVFHIVITPRFEFVIMGLIMLNVIIMAMRYHGQPDWYDTMLDVFNLVFGAIFILEVVFKNIGLGWVQYWSSGWNRFDFLVVCINVITFFMSTVFGDIGVDFTLLRAVRVVRLFRLVKTSRRLRTIFSTLFLSLPSLANVGALLLLLFFMYAIAGMSLFADVPHGNFITEHANFEEFIDSMLLLLRMSTGESWNGIMHDCVAGGVPRGVVFFYFTSFMLLGQFMMLNLFVAVILENFEREMEAESDDNEIKPEHLDAFAALWAKLAVKQHVQGTGSKDAAWLPAEKLAEILLSLPPPLGLHTHHRTSRSRLMKAIRVLDIPINKQGKIHYSQTLRALVRRVCGEDLPTDMDEATQKHLPHSLQLIQPFLSSYSTSQLFAAKFVQLWVRSVYARRKAMAGPHHGRLVLTVLGARHLKDLDAFGKQDPYVSFWVEPESTAMFTHHVRKARGRQRDKVGGGHGFTDTRVSGGTDCYWNGLPRSNGRVELRLDSPVVGNGAVVVWAEAWDEDLTTADDLIGMAQIPIFAALVKGEDAVTVPLMDARGAGGCGELCVRVAWLPDGGEQKVAPLHASRVSDPELSEDAIQQLLAQGEAFQRDFEAERQERSRRGSAASASGSGAAAAGSGAGGSGAGAVAPAEP